MFSLPTGGVRRAVIFMLAFFLLAGLIAGCSAAPSGAGSFAQVPAGKAYADGKEIYFAHTEVSDPDVAETLTKMMDSPVLVVPALADVPESARANVYVFENGLSGKGPLGFQPDVFNNPPGSDGYTPLRQIILVRWVDGAQARELKSEEEIQQAEAAGELSANSSDVVVNMPFMVWDGGQR